MSYSILTSTHGTSVQSSEGRREILVDSAADLTSLPDDTAPGSVAYTADFSGMWMKNNAGKWQEIGGGG